ncbi:MAG TPA: pyrroloquinoline quinone biosynthesis peptide chaperone PqqD [Steroidobacteraceae bacterium]|jgi:pyrroloquinoline quinone biosynthesis protein D
MADPAPVSRAAFPRIAPLYRFQWEAAQNGYVLLFPEGMVQLNGAAGEILRRCDGQRSAADIIADLKKAFQSEEIDADVVAFLQTATQDGWVMWRDSGQP